MLFRSKFGAKLGWRFVIGPGGKGFIFEPSFGYNLAAGFGDTFEKQLAGDLSADDIGDLGEMFNYLEKYVFIGGPRMSLAFGFRF